MSATAGDTTGPDGNGDTPFNGSAGCSAVVGATTISVATPSIVLSGTKSPTTGDDRLLTGQLCTAQFNGAMGAVLNYTWSIPTAPVSGSPTQSTHVFKTYDYTAPNITNSTQLVQLTSMDLSGPNSPSTSIADLPFYDRAAENLIVTCTASFFAPDYSTILTVNENSPTINVLKPTATWGIKSGWVQSRGTTDGFYGHAGTAYTDGQSWHDVTVTVPSPFSGGSYCFAQLITPDRKVYRQLPPGWTTNPYYQVTNNTIQGLDNQFPYAPSIDLSSLPPAGTEIAGDSPAISILAVPNASDGGGNNWNQWVYSDSVTTWLMYQPSGTGAVWVPLQSYIWSWSATVTLSTDDLNPGWNITASNPATESSAPSYTAMDTNDPPIWSLTHSNTDTMGPPPP
jgi:hypothetical protein